MTVSSAAPLFFGSVSAVTATRGSHDPEVGTVRREGDEDYIYVYNTGNSQITVGKGAVCSAVTGYSVTVSSLTHTDFPIGVCKHATLTTGTYGWLLTKGFSGFSSINAAAAGEGLTLGVDGAWEAKLLSTAYSQVVAPTVYGKVMVAATSGSTGDAYFRIG
jgi:hypothetical protein